MKFFANFLQMKAIETENSTLPYNFLIAGDGETYEIRGWSEQSGFSFLPHNTSLTIGILGKILFKNFSVIDICNKFEIRKKKVRSISIHRQIVNLPRHMP